MYMYLLCLRPPRFSPPSIQFSQPYRLDSIQLLRSRPIKDGRRRLCPSILRLTSVRNASKRVSSETKCKAGASPFSFRYTTSKPRSDHILRCPVEMSFGVDHMYAYSLLSGLRRPPHNLPEICHFFEDSVLAKFAGHVTC